MRLTSLFAAIGSGVILATSNPIYKEVAHSLGYDALIAANAATGASNSVSDLISILDQFKPIVHPEVATTINTLELFRGLVSSLVGYIVKTWIRNFYTGGLLNDTPFIGELIRKADDMITPEYKQVFNSLISTSGVHIAK